jgi:hypothetical protein
VQPQQEAPSDTAVDCFTHGLAHLIDEMGVKRAIAWVAGAMAALDEAAAGELEPTAAIPHDAGANALRAR